MNGPFGNGFPYTNFHELNMDWIIRIAKDFLDQYTHIQDIITAGETSLDEHTAAGLESLQAEKERLEGLLDAWYTEHSEDIAGELTSAVADFRTAAEAIGAEVIASIPADYTALSNSFTLFKETVSQQDLNGYNFYQGIDFIQGKAIMVSNGNQATNSAFNCTDYIDISGCAKIVYSRPVTTASSASNGMAFYDESKDFISGSGLSNKTHGSAAGAIMNIVDVPENAVYARFTWWNKTSLQTYKIVFPFFVFNYTDFINFNKGNIKTDILAINKAFGIPVQDTAGIRYETGNVSWPTAAYNASDFIDVSDCTKIVYTRPTISGSSVSYGMAFYDSEKAFITDSGIPNKTNSGQTGFEMYTTDVPETAKYARFTWWTDTYKETYNIKQNFAVYNYDDYKGSLQNDINDLWEFSQQGDPYNSLGLHTKPENNGVLNVIKRCRQLTDITWTPAKDLPRSMMVTQSAPFTKPVDVYEGVFKAGVTYKGLPYGNSVNYPIDGVSINTLYGKPNGYIGINIDIDSFITSVVNENSLLCAKSQYSETPLHRSLVYSVVCSSLVCYAINVPFKETYQIPSISGMTEIGNIISDGVRMDINSTLKLGDIINQRYHHVSIITDIVKNSNNEIEYIEISEATVIGNGNQDINGGPLGGVCRRLAFTVDDFFDRYAAYTLYRYRYIASVPYTKSVWVNVGDELPMNPIVNYPCMPYEGEGFKFNEGKTPSSKILINCNDYSYLRVFKDGTETANSPYAVTAEDEELTIDYADPGNYTAYLCNMADGEDTAVTASCHWSVIAST